MGDCSDVRLPGEPAVLGAIAPGRIVCRWEGDDENDYIVERPAPPKCLVLITNIGRRSTPEELLALPPSAG